MISRNRIEYQSLRAQRSGALPPERNSKFAERTRSATPNFRAGAHMERNSEIDGALPGAQTLNLRSNSTQFSVKIVEFSYLD